MPPSREDQHKEVMWRTSSGEEPQRHVGGEELLNLMSYLKLHNRLEKPPLEQLHSDLSEPIRECWVCPPAPGTKAQE